MVAVAVQVLVQSCRSRSRSCSSINHRVKRLRQQPLSNPTQFCWLMRCRFLVEARTPYWSRRLSGGIRNGATSSVVPFIEFFQFASAGQVWTRRQWTNNLRQNLLATVIMRILLPGQALALFPSNARCHNHWSRMGSC